MNPEGQKFGGVNISIKRINFGSGTPLSIGPDDQIPDQTALTINARGDWFVPNTTLGYSEFFRFTDFEFELNVVTATHTGEVTSLPDKKDLRDDSFMFEINAYPIKTNWTIKANLILTIEKKSTGEIFTPRYEFDLGPLHQDILGFGVNTELYREMDIILDSSVPGSKPGSTKQLELPPNPETMKYWDIELEMQRKAEGFLLGMYDAYMKSQHINPDPEGTGNLGPVPNAVSQPWYIDQTLYEQAMTSGGLTSGIETIFIDSVRQYYQTVGQFFNHLWKYEALHNEFIILYQNTNEILNQIRKSIDHWWDPEFIVKQLWIMIIDSLPGFKRP